jgi:Protein of unknown function (DUF3024)
MAAAVLKEISIGRLPHPNDVDRKRIGHALKARKRYRYVVPSVRAVMGGYLIESPCCSRNIDAEGGIIDVALLQYDGDLGLWQLYRKDHGFGRWDPHSKHVRLSELLDLLNTDSERIFWQ